MQSGHLVYFLCVMIFTIECSILWRIFNLTYFQIFSGQLASVLICFFHFFFQGNVIARGVIEFCDGAPPVRSHCFHSDFTISFLALVVQLD